MELIGKRKLVAFVAGTAANTLAVCLGHIDPGVYSVVAVALVGGFFAGNVASNRARPPA